MNRTDLSLDLIVRERYQLLQFLPPNASRELVFGIFQDIQDILALSDEEVEEWGFERSEIGVTHPDPEYDEEGDRVKITMKRTLWARVRSGANMMRDFPNNDFARATFTRLDVMLNEAAVLKKSNARSAPKAVRKKAPTNSRAKEPKKAET